MKYKFNAFLSLVKIIFNTFKPSRLRKVYGYLCELQRCEAILNKIEKLPDSDATKIDKNNECQGLYSEIYLKASNSMNSFQY